ncbi:MAG TPA: C10 family peptidase [Verrucomicrobiae bacterium]|jgi:hypothetical protein
MAILACAAGTAAAAPIGLSSATNFVAAWLASDSAPFSEKLGPIVRDTETVKDARRQNLYYAVHFARGGFVLVAADDQIEPIVAFGAKGSFAVSAQNALRALAAKDLPARLALARAHPGAAPFVHARGLWRHFTEGEKSPPGQAFNLVTNVAAPAVAPFLQTLWDQTAVGHDSTAACYNYFTPPFAAGNVDNYPCGCIATAMAQMMYYFQFPTAGVGSNTFGIGINGVQNFASLRGGDGAGGPYAWSNMPIVPENPSAAQCQAIGALTHDAGVSISMAYTAGDSESTIAAARQALTRTFLYSNAIMAGQDNPALSLSPNLINIVNPNLDARLPVMFGIWSSPSEGHCVLCDGYGYLAGVLYHHLNLGYSGVDNGWYALPDINTAAELTYTNISSCIYNVYPGGSGEIISGRIVDYSGNAVPGAAVTATRAGGGIFTAVSGANGIYALARLPSASSYTLAASRAGFLNASHQWSTGASQNGSAATGNVWGANFVLTNTGTPAILIPPQNQTVLAGGAARFSVFASGTGALAYQWSQNGLPLPASGSALAISNAGAASAGTYAVVVSNASGATASAGAVLSVAQPGGAQLVQNGGFETGTFADWTLAGNTADTFVSGAAAFVHAGSGGAALGPSGSLGFLSQNLPTTSGAAYLLSFWLDSPDGKTPNEFLVSWNGTNLFDAASMGQAGWTSLSFLAAASSASTPLEFGFRNDSSYFGLDAVAVNNLIFLAPPPSLSAQAGPGGAIVLALGGFAGSGTVAVQASSDLAQWVPIFTNASAASSTVFTDLPPASASCRYYRAAVKQ